MAAEPYRINPNDPRAPPQEVGERLTPEGDPHFEAKVRTREVLGGFFSRIGRKVYLACELPQHGFYPSEVLGLELQLEGERLRFFRGRAPLPESDEMIATLERMLREAEEHRSEEERLRTELEQRLAEESRLRAEESRRREEAERRLAEALAELERLRRGRN